MLGALLCVLSIFGPISRVSVNGLHLHCRRDPLPGKSTAAKHPNPFMPGWLDAEPVPRRPSAGSVGVTPNDDAHPEHMRSLRKSATSGRLRLFFLGGNLPGAFPRRGDSKASLEEPRRSSPS